MSRLSLVVLVASKTYKKKEKGLRKASPQDKVVTETSYLRKWKTHRYLATFVLQIGPDISQGC